MSVYAYCSSDFDSLVGKLADTVAEERSDRGGLIEQWRRSVTLVVPSLDMGAFVEQTAARLGGVAVNYNLQTIQNFMVKCVEETCEEGQAPLLDRETLKTRLLACFKALEGLPEEAREPIEEYLTPPADDVCASVFEKSGETRQYQLARTLATVFEEYSYSRPSMLDGWSRGERYFQDQGVASEIEGWQAALWTELVEQSERKSLTQAFDEVRESVAEQLREASTGGLHVFGFAGMGNAFLTALAKLGHQSDVDVYFYFFSPVDDPFNMGDGARHRTLRLWSTVGADTAAQLEELADDGLVVLDGEAKEEAEEGEDDGSSKTLLSALQGQVRSNLETSSVSIEEGDRKDATDKKKDDESHKDEEELDEREGRAQLIRNTSLRFMNCPGVRREVEVVANDIWERIANADDDSLRFSDFAVVLPQSRAETYLAHIESAFNSFEELPHTVNSIALGSRSPVLDAVESLLELPLGRFRRSEVLSLLIHPNFSGRFDDIDEEDWIDWTEKLNILYGADRDHQRERGSYLTGDLFNWEQGMKRLSLGAFLSPEDGPKDAEVDLGGLRYLPEDLNLSDVPSASALNTAASSLLSDAMWLRAKNPPHDEGFSLERWAEILVELVDTYIAPSTAADADFQDEIIDIACIKAVFEELGDLPDIGPVSYRTAVMYARDGLSKLQVGAQQKFTGGVVVSTTQRLRAIPFEHIYVLGAGEGDFPAPDPRSELDLRNEQERQRGDVWPSQRDKYHFLEILQSARSTLTLSWVGRDGTTGDELPPSSIVSDLWRMVDDPEQLTYVHPLRRYDAESYYFSGLADEDEDFVAVNHHPEAFEEARMRAIRDAIYGEERPGRTIWTGRALSQVQDRLGNASLKMLRPAGEGEAAPSLTTEISISKLASFLKSPLQASAKTTFGVYDDEDDTIVSDRESFKFDTLTKYMVAQKAFSNLMLEGKKLGSLEVAREIVDEVIDEEYRKDDLPVEVFGEVERKKVAALLKQLGHNFGGENLFAEHFEIGRPFEVTRTIFSSQPVEGEINAPVITVEDASTSETHTISLVGKTPLHTAKGQTFVAATLKKNPETKDFLSSYVAHLVLAACGGERAGVQRRCIVVPTYDWASHPSKWSKFSVIFDAVNSAEARGQLRTLIEALLVTGSRNLLPIEAVDEFSGEELSVTRSEAWSFALDKDTGGGRGGIRTQYGPVANYLDYPPPHDPAKVIEERFRYHEKLGVTPPKEDK